MTEEQVERSRRRFEIAGAIACAHCLGYLLWVRSTGYHRGPRPNYEYVSLVGNIAMSLSCYLGAYRFLDRYCILPLQRFRPNWIALSFLGTSLTFAFASIPVWYGYRGDTMERFIVGFLLLLAFVNLLILPVMTLVWSAGYIFRLVIREIDYSKVAMD